MIQLGYSGLSTDILRKSVDNFSYVRRVVQPTCVNDYRNHHAGLELYAAQPIASNDDPHARNEVAYQNVMRLP